MKERYEIVEQRIYRNKKTGATASIYGSRPSWPENETEIVKTGYSVRDNKTGTVHGRIGETKEDAEKRITNLNKTSSRYFI